MDLLYRWLCRAEFPRSKLRANVPVITVANCYDQVLLSLIFLAPSFRYLERLWGPFETAKFIAIVVVVSNFISFIINWVEYAVTGYEFFMYV